jgi:hypothetical protein
MIRLSTNLTPTQVAALNLQTTPAATFADADLIVVEARSGHGELTDQQADVIAERVRAGATLLVTLSADPQLASMRLGRVLPAVTWQVASRHRDTAPTGETTIATADQAFFSAASPVGKKLPYFFSVRPLSADERGQSTYSRYKRNIPLITRPVEAGDDFWTRPLHLRDVRIHLTAADNAQSPLLASARYGAGRTILFGSGFDQLSEAALLPAILNFLAPTTVSAAAPAPAAPTLDIAYGKHSILLTLASSSSIPVELVARAYTWQDAPLGHEHDLVHPVTLTPGKAVTVEMPLPPPSGTNYQAIDHRDAYRVRVAVLSANGATTLLQRQLLADFSPALDLHLVADDINHWEYPFHAPGPGFNREFGARSGAQIGAYVYPPGAKVSATISLSNGLHDLAALTTVADETTPGNPSASALVDGGMVSSKKPIDSIGAWSYWEGKQGVENTLTFTFPHPVTLASVALAGDWRPNAQHNPESVTILIDGRKVGSSGALASQFAASSGLAHIEFAPTTGSKLTLTLPPNADPKTRRFTPQLTQVRFEGWSGKAPEPITSDLVLSLTDGFTGAPSELSSQKITLQPGERKRIPVSFKADATASPTFHSLRAVFNTQSRQLPLVSLQPARPLRPYTDIVDPATEVNEGFIVTAGFRFCFPLGTGTQERQPGSWANPDDLIWAYSRQMKEIGPGSKTHADKLYLSDNDMRHYAAPWRPFNDGTLLYTAATPNLIELFRKKPHYKEAKAVHLGHSDRWDTGPHMETLHSWQDLVEFDRHLREAGKPGLAGKTKGEITAEIHDQHEDAWQAYQLNLYLTNLRTVRDGFKAEGKKLLITAQGVPIVAGAAGSEIGETIQAMSDDHSWGMAEGSVSLTTGRQIAEMAYNPVWKMSTLIQYGYSNGPLENPEWHCPPGTLEPTRREYYDRAWRATIWPDGKYASVYTVGYNDNAGVTFRMTDEDWNHWWRIEELHSLLSPEEPLGAGLVISTSRFADPNHTRFTADGNLFAASPDGYGLARLFQRLTDAGLSIPFSANAASLANWQGSAPLIALTPEVYSAEELATLSRLKARGIRMAAFTTATLTPATQLLFAVVLPIAPLEILPHQAESLLAQLHTALDLPLRLPANTRGYGFRQQGVNFLVVQDWRTRGHMAEVRLRATSGKATCQACSVNDHVPLKVRRDGPDWVIAAPMRPGDGHLIAVRES